MWEDVLKNLIAVPKQKLRSSKSPIPEESDCLEELRNKVENIKNIPKFKYNVITTGNYDKQGADWIVWIGENTYPVYVEKEDNERYYREDKLHANDPSILGYNNLLYSHGVHITSFYLERYITEELACWILECFKSIDKNNYYKDIDMGKYSYRFTSVTQPFKHYKSSFIQVRRIPDNRTIMSISVSVTDFHLHDDVGFKITASSNFDKINVGWWK